MPLPVAVETRTVRLTMPLDALGKPPRSYEGRVNVDRALVWEATGDRLWPAGAPLPNVVDGAILVPVPIVDQDGWVDGQARPVTGWSYRVTVTALWRSGERQTVTRTFQVVEDTPAVIELELLPEGATEPLLLGNPVAGPEGPVGPVGPEGPAGPVGPVGPAGAVGPEGPEGPEGPQGLAGADGAPGAPGAPGAAGAVGPAGPAGPVGPAGPAGPAGADGADGEDGAQGPIGPAGPAGAVGPAGADGEDGAQGPQGEIGPAGPAGPAGAVGPAGPAGPAGPEGPEGDVGPAGPAGADGADGVPGAVGPEGPAGPAGPEGPAGPAGPEGPEGDVGPAGPEGDVGPAGPTGPGVPNGGATGQVLAKTSGVDQATAWVDREPPWTYERLGADWTNGTAIDTDIFAGFAPAANKSYEIEVCALVESAIQTTAIQVGLAGPSGSTTVVQHVQTPGTATSVLDNHIATFGRALAGTTVAQPAVLRLRGLVRYGAAPGAGNVRLQGRSETGAGSVVTMYAKSYMRWRELP